MIGVYDLIERLDRLKVETGSLACFGCGYEHNCSTQGCAIIRDAAETLQRADNTIQALQSCLDMEVRRLKDENRSIRENSVSKEAADLLLMQNGIKVEDAVDQLKSLRADAEYKNTCDPDNTMWEADVAALRFAIAKIEKEGVVCK